MLNVFYAGDTAAFQPPKSPHMHVRTVPESDHGHPHPLRNSLNPSRKMKSKLKSLDLASKHPPFLVVPLRSIYGPSSRSVTTIFVSHFSSSPFCFLVESIGRLVLSCLVYLSSCPSVNKFCISSSHSGEVSSLPPFLSY